MSPQRRGSVTPLKQALLRGICGVLRSYFRHIPITVGRLWVWNHIMRPFVNWRRLELVATTRFWARNRGALSHSILRSLFLSAFGRLRLPPTFPVFFVRETR